MINIINLLLFIVAFAAVFLSSYFITAVFKSKSLYNNIIYFILIFISTIIIQLEFLSLIKQINMLGIIFINTGILISSFCYWYRNKKPVIDFNDFKTIKLNILKALLKDKYILVLAIVFVFANIITLFLSLAAPSNSFDAMSYHLARVAFWLQNQTISHYITSSVRQVVLPVNSELLMLWPMVFLKRDYLAVLNQLLAYWGCLFVVFCTLTYLKYDIKRVLWTVFIVASFPAVLLEASSLQTDLPVAFLILSSIYLFIYAVKEKSNKAIIFSALACGISLGIKYTAFAFLPVLLIIFTLILLKNKKNFNGIFLFLTALLGFGSLLSSYNYFLNYFDFGNPIISESFLNTFYMTDKIKSALANIIRYLFLFFDFTAIPAGIHLTPMLITAKKMLFLLFGLKSTDGLAYLDVSTVNVVIHENYSTYGLLGFLLFLPFVLKKGLIELFKKNKKRSFYTGLMAFSLILYLIIISAFVGFSLWNNRYLTSAVIVASPVLIYTYTRKNSFWKLFVVLVIIFNFIAISAFNNAKPLKEILQLVTSNSFLDARNKIRNRNEVDFQKYAAYFYLSDYLKKIVPNNSRIGIIFSCDDWYYPLFETNPSWKITQLNYKQPIQTRNFNDYDYIITSGNYQVSEILDFNKIKYHYKISNQSILYEKITQQSPVVLYLDINRKIFNPDIKTQKPFFESSLIDPALFDKNFKLIKTINVMEENNVTKEVDNSIFNIYQRL